MYSKIPKRENQRLVGSAFGVSTTKMKPRLPTAEKELLVVYLGAGQRLIPDFQAQPSFKRSRRGGNSDRDKSNQKSDSRI
jgi:hypothetical protein